MRRAIGLLVVAAALAAAPVAAAAAPVARPRLLFVGDSLLVEATPSLQAMAAKAGMQVEIDARGGTAICDWVPAAPKIRDRFRPDVVVMAFSGNSMTSCMDGNGGTPYWGSALGVKYYKDLEAMSTVFDGPRPVTWVIAPVLRWWSSSRDAAAAAYVDAARWRNDVRVVDGGALITPGRTWVQTLPCLAGEPCVGPVVAGERQNVVRSPDGLHFCPTGYAKDRCPTYSSGAYRYARTLFDAARRLVGR